MTNNKPSKKRKAMPASLPMTQATVAGIDIGSKEHWVAAPPDGDDANVRRFGTTTPDLVELVDWLRDQGVTSAAMESTSVYWIPLYELLESRGIQPVLVNARHLHNVPGRKTDFLDCQWLQLLHSRGLLRGSFRPGDAIARLRALHRQQANLVEHRTCYLQWMQKALDQMNVQVHRAVADLSGKTGMTIVRAIVAGERDAVRLAAHRDARCKKSLAEIARCLTGTWRDEHLFNLASALQMYDALERQIADYDQRMLSELDALQPPERRDEALPPHPNRRKELQIKQRGNQPLRTTLWRLSGADLTRIDGIAPDAAMTIVTEVGTNLAAFPSERHFVSWLRLCPRTPISGGRPLRKRPNAAGANRIASVLHMAAVSLNRSKTALGAAYRRIARHKGAGVAVFATARRLAELVYRVLRYGHQYVDIGEEAYELKYQTRRLASVKEAARSLGFKLVEDEPTLAT
jgi:transposase